MLKSILDFFMKKVLSCIDLILPYRTDYDRVKHLSFQDITHLPQATSIEYENWITSLFQYKNKTVRSIIWELKYHNNSRALEHIGELMFEEIIATISDIILFDADARFLLLPIPISPHRRATRGYNQSEYIARSILEHDTEHILLYAPQWFEKIRETEEQNKSRSRGERTTNLLGCFSAREHVAGYHVILVDDVVTTGSTLSEARTTLLEAGARDVVAFTIAH